MENTPNGYCPCCGRYTLYSSLVGEWCESCGYETITDY